MTWMVTGEAAGRLPAAQSGVRSDAQPVGAGGRRHRFGAVLQPGCGGRGHTPWRQGIQALVEGVAVDAETGCR